jgi:hypothetical protein
MVRVFFLIALFAALVIAPEAKAQGQGRVIRVTDEGPQSIGSFKTTGSGRRPYATLAQAIVAFGHPSSRRRIHGRTGCLVRWNSLRLRIDFENFSAVPRGKSACTPRYGLAQSAHIGGAGWITDRGLSIGSPVDQITGLYPEAEQQPDGTWWLLTGLSPIGACDDPAGCPYAILSASADSGFVEVFDLPIGAAGE